MIFLDASTGVLLLEGNGGCIGVCAATCSGMSMEMTVWAELAGSV